MPVSPELTVELVKGLVEVYTQAEQTLLRIVADRLAQGIDAPDWAERKLADIGRVRQQMLVELAKLQQATGSGVDEVLRLAWNRGAATAATDLAAAGVMPEMAFGVVNDSALTSMISDLTGQLDRTHPRILRSILDVYRDTIADASGQLLTGTQTRRQAAQRALDRFASRGITGFVDARGRSWDLASYTEMSLRSGAGRAVVEGHTERLVANGRDLVIVSDAPQECKLCRPWEGKVLSITGSTRGRLSDGRTVAGTLDDARAAGLFHANCRHRTAIYIEGETRPMHDTADPEGDAARQQLRYLERGVRQWKRRAAAALDDDARKAAEGKAREWQARIREHVASSPAKRRPERERLGAR